MFRQTAASICVRIALVTFLTGSICSAQQSSDAGAGTADIDPKLWQLLTDWSKASSKIKKLSGKHERHIYDNTFEVEKVSTGKFWYEAPDKGRIDVSPVKISPAMLQAREEPGAQVRRGKNGKPFKLQSDDAERWLCNGKDVYDIDDEAKEAQVAALPPQMRGENIMNSPLPFLFGLPPEQAVKRFRMEIVKDYRPKFDVVQLKALPLWRSDAQNWSEAKIMLDTKQYLPTAVQLIDPPQTAQSVYKFKDLVINRNGLFDILKDPFEPNLRGYKITLIKPQQRPAAEQPADQPIAQRPMGTQKNATPAAGGVMVPNVVGLNHAKATQVLVQAGVPAASIKRLRGGPAPTPQQKFVVKAQQPQANTPLKAGAVVTLLIFEEAKAAAANGQPQARVAVRN